MYKITTVKETDNIRWLKDEIFSDIRGLWKKDEHVAFLISPDFPRKGITHLQLPVMDGRFDEVNLEMKSIEEAMDYCEGLL